ncbi:MAX dimerization protein MGA a isoform X3 [Rhincodon typus]|uniref:MAX dimerization protein MGA a isoform X3 n=1 Tax=Rhincodon typus TaxID=259920 RepID=UPI00202F3FFA|nr:MAX dimerization protein MGA a isoform X3 [Rhincodon typus]
MSFDLQNNMEKQQLVYTKQETNTSPNSGTPAAYFVILKQAPGSGGTERSMLVAKQELGGVLEKRNKLGPGSVQHPFECRSGNVCVTLENQEMWSQFYKRGTEMILTKHGRRMFPNCKFCISGLDSSRKYILVMDIAPVDNHRYKWNGRWWEVNGKAEPHVLGRVYIHPNSPSSGSYWMRQPISFYKLKLTNNTLDQEGHIILHSMHRYLPRLHVIPTDKPTDVIPLNGPNVLTFTFPQTEFVAVTAYQNIKITQLKIDFNPFAKGFRDDGLNSRPMRELRHRSNESTDGGCSDDSASSRSAIIDSSRHYKIKSEEQSETHSRHRKMQGDVCASPAASFDGELYNTDEEEGCLEAEIPGASEFDSRMGMRQKRSTESILKQLPNVYSTHPFSITSSEDQEESFNIIIKEEPPDDDEYYHAANRENLDNAGLKCKKEEEDYLDSSSNQSTPASGGQLDGANCELANKTTNKNGVSEVDTITGATKRPLSSSEGVAKAKMLRMESGKMPVVCLEPCTITKGTIKLSDLPQKFLSPCRRNWAPRAVRSLSSVEKPTRLPSSAEKSKPENVDSLPYKENDSESVSGRTKKKRNTSTVSHSSIASNTTPSQKACSEDSRFCNIKHTEKTTSSRIWSPARKVDNCPEDSPIYSKSTRLSTKAISSGIWRPPDGTTDSIKEIPMLHSSSKSPCVTKQQHLAAKAYRRSRSKRLRQSAKAACTVSAAPVSQDSSEHLEQEEVFCDVSPDLDDVEGVTFVSYASQDALQSHLVEQVPENSSDAIHQTAVPQESDEEKIERLEEKLIEDLTHLDSRVIMHPSLKAAGVKPSSLMSKVSLNLKHLGVVLLPPSAGFTKPDWRDDLECSPSRQTDQSSPAEEEIPFVSRTGKTNDFTKLKGWKQKLAQQSGTSVSKQTEATSSLENTVKNRSAFLSDKLDEYLENEEKIIKQRADLCINKVSKVVYQMPTKSSSYVRTLDSVLKHRTSEAAPGQSRSSSQAMVSPQPISVGSVSKACEQNGKVMRSNAASKEQKSSSSTKSTPKTSSPSTKTCSTRMRPPGLSKKQKKLMDLENSALWDGKSRTYITEERAEASLLTLLTAQGKLQTRKHRVIPKRAPICKNEFCRLGCICSSLSQMKEPPTHCRKPECMFNCKCPKREMLVLKTFGRRRRQLSKALREDLIFYDALADDDEWKPRTRKRKKKKVAEYAIPEPEQPMRPYPLWIRQEGEVDPEPVYTAPHLESYHSSKCPPSSQPPSPLSPKGHDSTKASVSSVLSTPASSPKPSEADEKGPVYWYFESMMTCARVCAFKRKRVERSIICTCSSEHGCGQENSLYSKVNNKDTLEACKLKQCSDSSSREVLDFEKLEDSESDSMSPNPSEMCKSKKTQDMDLDVQCDSPQKDTAECPSAELQTAAESKNTPKLIEIISNCNWEAERASILKVIACHTVNKGTSEKIRTGNFLVEIMPNCENSQVLSPEGVPIYSSLVKITQPGIGERDGKMSVHTMSIQKVSQSSGRKLPETRLIAPKETPFSHTTRKSQLASFRLSSHAADKGKPVSNANLHASYKTGLIQVSGNENGETKLTLGQVGALHSVNKVIANLKRKLKSTELLEKCFSDTTVSSNSAQLASKQPVSCTTSNDSRVSQNAIDAAPVNKTTGLPRQPEAANSVQSDSSKAVKTNRPRLLLIPAQSGTSSVRPVQNLQLSPGQKMVLQPLRCPSGNLFRHPNGQIIQLVPLTNAAPGTRPNLHQMVTFTVRNPGSTGGIRFPTPTKTLATPPSSNAPSRIVQPGIIPPRGRPRIIPFTKAIPVALKVSSVATPVNPVGMAVPIATTPQTEFVTVNAASNPVDTTSNPVCAGSLVPLQPMGFALLQLPPGQKLLPNTIITTGGPLKFVSPQPGVPLTEKTDGEKGSTGEKSENISNQDSSSTSKEQPTEPGLEDIHVAGSELVETTVTENLPGEDHVCADPLPEVKLGEKSEAAPSSPSLSELDDEVEDHSLDKKAGLEKSTPAELADHSYTIEMHNVKDNENGSSLQEDTMGPGKELVAEQDTSESNTLIVEKEPDNTCKEQNCLQDEIMEVKTENCSRTNTSDTSFKCKEDIQNDSENEEFVDLDSDLQYVNNLESDKDSDSPSDMEDGEIPSDIEEIDIEKMFDSTSSEEAVDIETVDELSEKINIARLIASASHHRTKAKCHFHNPYLIKKAPEEDPKPKEKPNPYLSREAKAQLDALVVYRTAHTVNERRRRSEMRDLFEKLKRTLGLRREQKASKYYILKQAFSEIQNLQDHADRLSAERSIQTRKRDLLIRKVSLLTGKTEEVILKKLEYICAKQRALDVQKKNIVQQGADAEKQHCDSWKKPPNSSETMDILQKVAMNLQTQKPPNVTMLTSKQDQTSEAGKPLILTRKRSLTAPHSPVSSVPLTPGSLLMTPQGQVLTLKGSLVSGESPVFTTEGLLHGNQLIAKGDDTGGANFAGIALVTIQVQGLPVPFQVNNATGKESLSSTGTTSALSSTRPPGTEVVGSGAADVVQGKEPKSEASADSLGDENSSFLMPRIVNVTSLATGEAPSLNVQEMNDSFAEVDPQALDFSMKGRKQYTSQGEQISRDSKRISDLNNSSHVTGEFTALGESEVMPFLIVSSEASKSEHQQQAQQVATSHLLGSDKIDGSPKALDLSCFPDRASVSCTEKAWTREETSTGSAPTTEIILEDRLEFQVMSNRVQTCNTGKSIGLSDRDAELSPLLKANGTASSEIVDTDGYEPFTSLLNELAYLNQQFSDDEENPDASSMSDHQTLGFIDNGNQGEDIDELSLIHGPIRLVDIDGADEDAELKQTSERESGGSSSPLVLQLEGEDLNVEQLLSSEMPVDSQNELDDGTLDFEGNHACGVNSSVTVSPPPLVHMKAASPSTNTEVPSSLDMLWRPMPKLAPLGLIRVPGKVESVTLTEHSSENNRPMPALARISSPQTISAESP